MSNETKSTIFLPIGAICILAFIVFLILKLTGAVAWSWLTVCVPLIVLASIIGLILLFCLIAFLLLFIVAIFKR